MSNSAKQQVPPGTSDCGCKEKNSITQGIINAERRVYCDWLDTAGGSVFEYQERYDGTKKLKKKKKILFIWTEKNYQAVRNLEITKGTSLLQFNESIKEATTGFLKDNKTLADNLKDIVKRLKEVVSKTNDLLSASCELKRCVNDGCNCTQKGILTGDWGEKCKGNERKLDQSRCQKDCEKVKEKLELLYSIPEALSGSADSLLKGAADVSGIQVFSNVGTLEGLQKSLYDSIKAFQKHLGETSKKELEEMKKAQEEFVKSVLDHAKAEASLYDKRGDFTGLYNTAAFLCCHDCKCIERGNCKDRICEICNEVKETFCNCPPENKPC